jgi:cell division inhibitor SepF
MSIADKFKDWFLVDKNNPDALPDDEEDEVNGQNETKNTIDSPTPPIKDTHEEEPYQNRSNDHYEDNHSRNQTQTQNSYNPKAEKTYVNVNTRLEVVLVRPEVFTDAKQIADHLIKKKTVVLNLENTTPEVKRRIIDFLAGVTYSNGGSIKPVANLTYIITPYGVGFVGDELVGELENNGVVL